MEWDRAIELVTPHVVKIITPQMSGTGFIIDYPGKKKFCGIATAAHVINHAHSWESPIRLKHFTSGKDVLLRYQDRAIFVNYEKDAAVILFSVGELRLPDVPLELISEGEHKKLGVELGWLGFPAIANESLCFFSGRVSHWLDAGNYLVDGVAINGVSGGPTFSLTENGAQLVGIVTDYIPNRATGVALPGLCMVRDVSHFQKVIKDFRSIDEAKEKETPPTVQATTGPAIDKEPIKPVEGK
jgi:hypothetical protein